LQNPILKFGVLPISYTWSNFRQNQHINEHHPAKQSYQIWRKNFQALPSNHILRVGSFFSRTLYIVYPPVHTSEHRRPMYLRWRLYTCTVGMIYCQPWELNKSSVLHCSIVRRFFLLYML